MVKYIFDGFIATRQGITYHDQVGRGLQMLSRISFLNGDTRGLEHGTHGRVHIDVRSCHLVAQLAS
jgi:hypothetical protein